MADKVSINIELKTDDKGITKATIDTKELAGAIDSVKKATSELNANLINVASLAQIADAVSSAFGQLNGIVSDLSASYAAQEIAETKLGQVMRNTMGATEAEIQSIKDLCAAQQELGVIGDEVQIAGAQELGTYLEKTDSLKALIPVMNDMVAQQYGLNASQESAVGIATMLGKVMEGQVGALSRYGYSFDEVEEQILKFGTEEEKVIVLSKVVGDSVGGMNQALAQTDSGQMQQLANAFGDMKEKIGEVVSGIQPAIASMTVFGDSVGSIMKLTQAFNALRATTIGQKAATLALTAAQKAATAAQVVWNGVQKAFNIILSANPIGIVIQVLFGLALAIKAAYDKCETFRNAVNAIWSIIKAKLTPVFETLGKVVKKIWNYMADLFGFDTSSTEETTDAIKDQADAYDDLYASMQKTMAVAEKNKGNAKKGDKAPAPQGSLKALQEQIQAVQAKVELEVDPTKRSILYNELDKLKKEKIKIEAVLEMQLDRTTLKSIMPKASDLPDPTKDMKPKGLKEFKQQYAEMEEAQRDMAKNQMTVRDNILSTADSFGVMGQAIGGAAGSMMQWAAQSVAAIMQVIPQIVTLMTAKQAEGMAGATASGASLPFPANIAAIAAGVATVIASFAKMPKFAAGGIISGPTIGLMGEYSGASNNPEVVAPLNKLKSMLGDVGGGLDGRVQFEIKGRKLVGVLARENSIRSRS